MKLSLKATYGILAAMDLALQNGQAPVSAKAIAQRQAIPARFLEQVLHGLKRAGIVESQRGAQGGYALSRSPVAISLAEIVEALEGPIGTERRAWSNGERDDRRAARESLLSHIVGRVEEAELKVLQGMTLKDMAERQREMEQEQAPMYHI